MTTTAAPDVRASVQHRVRRDRRDLITVGFVALVVALPVRGLLHYQGPPMEEGFMLVFGEQVLHGARPNVDFLHLYGPGSLWTLAGVFRVLGVRLWVERLIGLAQIAGIVSGVFVIARRWGRRVAAVCAVTATVIIVPPVGLTAMAWNGAVAFGVWAVYLGWAAGTAADDGRGRRRSVVAGVLAGIALLYRPDLALAITLAGASLLVMARRSGHGSRARGLIVGVVIGASPYLVHVARVGLTDAVRGMVLDPVFHLRAGRSLPVPPSWDHVDGFLQRAGALRVSGWTLPMLPIAHQIVLWFAVLVFIAVGGAVVAVAHVRGDDSPRAQLLLAVNLFGLGLLPQAIQRPDTAHLAWVSCIPIALVPVTIAEILRRRSPNGDPRRWSFAGAAAVAAFVLLIAPQFTVRGYVDLSEQSFGRNVFGVPIRRDDRVFYYGDAVPADAAQALVNDLGARERPGQRLFVGPYDLRQTPYSDAFFYYLFPELKPATYFIEMDPGVANATGSRLASDVASADWLILSNVWSNWDEPNASRDVGPDDPNRVVAAQFCLVREYDGLFRLYQRCGT
jgi:hypothetical protein